MKHYVIKGADGMVFKDDRTERMPLTRKLMELISNYNGELTPEQVKAALLKGHPVYTTFSRYTLEA